MSAQISYKSGSQPEQTKNVGFATGYYPLIQITELTLRNVKKNTTREKCDPSIREGVDKATNALVFNNKKMGLLSYHKLSFDVDISRVCVFSQSDEVNHYSLKCY